MGRIAVDAQELTEFQVTVISVESLLDALMAHEHCPTFLAKNPNVKAAVSAVHDILLRFRREDTNAESLTELGYNDVTPDDLHTVILSLKNRERYLLDLLNLLNSGKAVRRELN